MRKRLFGRSLGLVLAVVATSALSAPVAAAGTPAADFGAQVRAAGLTPAEARTLQARVADELAREGGVRTAANEITRANGTELLLVLPGETYARDLDAPATQNVGAAAAPSSCAYYTFCAYRGTNFTGDVLRQKRCADIIYINWFGNGSWSNNQSSGARARMYGSANNVIYTTPGAYSEDRVGDWSPVFHVDAC
ncbi:hypothetical protein [Streptomyces sp. NPDC048845]|uniref:hypothetical protein n=1 Tax=Streptomyces sp. NPDC048845 TaxID=3155390 RepID=UPI00342AB199